MIFCHNNLEIIVVEVYSKPAFTLCLGYKLPNATDDYQSSLFSYLEQLVAKGHFVILGDFNNPDINWHTLTANSASSSTLCDIILSHNLYHLVQSPTHSKGDILDLVITNSPNLVNNLQLFNNLSDHCQVYFSIVSTPVCHDVNHKTFYAYDYQKGDTQSLCSFLLDHAFSEFLQIICH